MVLCSDVLAKGGEDKTAATKTKDSDDSDSKKPESSSKFPAQ